MPKTGVRTSRPFSNLFNVAASRSAQMTTARYLRFVRPKVKSSERWCAFESRSRCPYFHQSRKKRTGPPVCHDGPVPQAGGAAREDSGLRDCALWIWGQCRGVSKREKLEAHSSNSCGIESQALTQPSPRFAGEGLDR